MDVSKGMLLGLLTLCGLFLSVHSVCDSILHCQDCQTNQNVLQCLTCDEGYAQNEDVTGCCPKGCKQDQNSFYLCNAATGQCTYGCRSGYIGDTCAECRTVIERCEDCKHLLDDENLPIHCITCATSFYPTTNKEQCCPEGCDSCTGSGGTVTCTSCKQTYFLYNGGCDTCGNNCKPPSDGSARCDSVTGQCILGCVDGWHGLTCNVRCDINRCDTCQYINQNLTCQDCAAGFYGPYCIPCNPNCAATGTNEICTQDGTCSGGCKPGYRGNKCELACDAAVGLGNCAVCDRYQFICTVCKPGYWGDTCQNTCNNNCVPSTISGIKTCSLEQGSCDFGCLAGYYKHDCSGECPNCLNDVCDQNTGNCRDPFCDPGYYGSNCNFSCPVNCALNPNTNQAHCDFNYGNCTYGCIDGKWGQFCNNGCSVYCQSSPQGLESGPLCAQKTGVCQYQCKPGHYGRSCLTQCKSRCVDDTCDITAGTCLECDAPNPGYLCPSGNCAEISGVYYNGLFCNRTCPSNCDSTCRRYTAVCDACKAGYWNNSCDSQCGNCKDVSCLQNNGTCLSECEDGFYGSRCDKPCAFDGCRSCDRKSGNCTTCKQGLWGENCENTCSDYCLPNNTGLVYCDKETSNCNIPACVIGYFSPQCRMECSANCLPFENMPSNKGKCEFYGGSCDDGCKIGWYGDSCDNKCSSYCVDSTCDRDGRCNDELGCLPGYYGFACEKSCDETCNDGLCDRTNGNCMECLKPYEEQSPLCRSAVCDAPFYGLYCNDTCPTNCKNGVCGRYNSVCNSCIDDFFGSGCDNPCGNCVGDICIQETGACMNGCDNGFYSSDCTLSCKHDGCQECSITTGECTSCKERLWGNNCEFNCSEFCLPNQIDGSVKCNRFTAVCLENACVPEYYGRDCKAACNEHCGVNNLGFRPCDIDTGICDVNKCDETWYGPQCNVNCPINCVNQNCNRTGHCIDGCLEGYWGATCQTQCQIELTCNDGTCGQTEGTCLECLKENPSSLCRTAACNPKNKWGVFCQFDCSDYCADGTCSRNDGSCSSCKPEKFGRTCDSDCPNCGTNVCYQETGVCVDKCDPGWYQLNCTAKCKYEGCQECERATGDCISCKIGKYGSDCSSDCAVTCARNNSGVITCNRFSGECDSKACQNGFYSAQCTKRCSQYCNGQSCDLDSGTCDPCIIGWYGQRCDSECSPNCKNRDCVATEANCRQGCIDGKWGGSCEKDCNSNCDSKQCDKETAECLFGCEASQYFGLICDEPCSENCTDHVCNRTGYCLRGCDPGWYGDQCQYRCSVVSRCVDGTCSRLDGTCEDCSRPDPERNCPTGVCPRGKRGNSCDEDCTSSNCLYDQCGRYNDSCLACPNGFYGDKCELTCTHCKAGTGCEQDTGDCEVGCQDGWYKPDCESECSEVCGSCERQSGDCITCAAGRWGTDCQSICSSNCVETHTGGNILVICDKTTGFCTERACKMGFWREDCTQACNSNCMPDDNNNRVCAYLDGECSKGCISTFFGKTCSGLCSMRCKDQLCTNFETACDISCADGYYGATCASTCSTHCAGAGRCNSSTGECFDGCELGYYGPRCDDGCKNRCVDGTCDSTGGCPDCAKYPVGPNCREQVCNAGLYGPTCESKCPGDYCLDNQCQRINGTCEKGCLSGYYGTFCVGRCLCDSVGTEECSQTNGECICKAGRHGLICDEACSDGCKDFTCERDGTCTVGCKDGRFGSKCDASCDNCLNKACNSANGNCIQGCIEGWYGSQCNLPCHELCKTCDIQTGDCTTCVDNYYGLPTCSDSCSNNCLVQGTGRLCNQANGICLYGCKLGYYSPSCTESCGNCDQCDPNNGNCPVCHGGWWGNTCKQQCSSTCARGGSSNERICRQSDGYCEYGCEAGYYESDCKTQCVGSNCLNGMCDRQSGRCTSGCAAYYYDTNCDQRCDSCKDGKCEQGNGNCVDVCPPNVYGNKCTKECLSICVDGTCDKYTGYCKDCQTSPKGRDCAVQDEATGTDTKDDEVVSLAGIIGITFGAVGVVIIFVVAIVCCMNYKRRYDDAKKEIHLPSDVIEQLSTHRSLHSTTSTNYPVARVVGDDNEKDFVLF